MSCNGENRDMGLTQQEETDISTLQLKRDNGTITADERVRLQELQDKYNQTKSTNTNTNTNTKSR